MLLTPKNIEFHATFLHSDVDIQERVIHFGHGLPGVIVNNGKLIEVPLGGIAPHDTIVITLGLDKAYVNNASVDSDPIVGITDGTHKNLFAIWDANNYPQASPCHVKYRTGTHDNAKVSSGTQAPSTIKLTFAPFSKFGFCETAQEGGYINTGTFNAQIDITKPLFLTVERSHAYEEYYFHYFKVEILEGL